MGVLLPSSSWLLKLPSNYDDDDDDDDKDDDNDESGGSVCDAVNVGNNDENSEEVQISDILCMHYQIWWNMQVMERTISLLLILLKFNI